MAKPIRMVTANLDFATGNRRDRPYLRRLGGLARRPARPRRRILFLQEAKTGRVRLLLSKAFWGKQGNGEAKSGTALMGRWVRLMDRRVWLAGRSSATLPRYVTEAVTLVGGEPVLCLSVHVFPDRAGLAAQRRYLTAIAIRLAHAESEGQAWVVGGDFNLPVTEVARRLGGQPFGTGIIGFVCSPDVWVAKRGALVGGLRRGVTDHPAYFIDVERVAA